MRRAGADRTEKVPGSVGGERHINSVRRGGFHDPTAPLIGGPRPFVPQPEAADIVLVDNTGGSRVAGAREPGADGKIAQRARKAGRDIAVTAVKVQGSAGDTGYPCRAVD